jgi:hypothetical protein
VRGGEVLPQLLQIKKSSPPLPPQQTLCVLRVLCGSISLLLRRAHKKTSAQQTPQQPAQQSPLSIE